MFWKPAVFSSTGKEVPNLGNPLELLSVTVHHRNSQHVDLRAYLVQG